MDGWREYGDDVVVGLYRRSGDGFALDTTIQPRVQNIQGQRI